MNCKIFWAISFYVVNIILNKKYINVLFSQILRYNLLISKKNWWYYNTIYFVSLLIIEIPVDIKMRNNWLLISRLFFVVGLQRMKKAKDQRQSWKSLRASKNCWVKKVDKTFFPVLVGKSAKNKLQKRIPSKLPLVKDYSISSGHNSQSKS